MNQNFPRVIALLRKEMKISQKQAAADLGISQALLSHYEKGIRECGLDFLVRCAAYYNVSADYLLGISPERQGTTLTVEDIPDPEAMGKGNIGQKSILPTLNKKLIANSLNILYDYLGKTGDKGLITEISDFLMAAVYKAFRITYSAKKENPDDMFSIPKQMATSYSFAAMDISCAKAGAIVSEEKIAGVSRIKNREALTMSPQIITKDHPQFATSLFNLIQRVESSITGMVKGKKSK